MNNDELLKEALSLLETYHDEIGRMLRRDQFYAMYIRHMELADLAVRYTDLKKKVKEEGSKQEPLTDHQKKYIKLFLGDGYGKCTDGYLMSKLGVFEWKEAEAMIEQYKREEGKNE
jgi:hypothetical protein